MLTGLDDAVGGGPYPCPTELTGTSVPGIEVELALAGGMVALAVVREALKLVV
jgi:hypothetical protein